MPTDNSSCATLIAVLCSACEKPANAKPTRRGLLRLPKSWKKHRGENYCPQCWGKLFKLRAVTFPVSEPLEGGTRDEMWQALRGCWGESTCLANWSIHELAKNDRPRLPADEKLQKPDAIYLYGIASDRYPGWERWAGCYAAAQSLMRAIEAKYSKARFEVVWRSAAALPRVRYPYPYPVHNAAWKPVYYETTGETGQTMKVPAVSVTFGGRRWLLRLRGGHERARQLGQFAKLVSGAAIKGELALYPQRSSNGAHRSTGAAKKAGGGQATRTRLMCKLVAWLPRETYEKNRTGTLEVRTARNCLWVAIHAGREEPWLLHANYLRGIQRSHSKRIQALSDDTKVEWRRPRRTRQNYQGFLDKLTYRYKRRMRSALEHVAAMLVQYADRCDVRAISYDDSDSRYCPDLAWTWLRQLVEAKAEDLGVGFERASSQMVKNEESNGDGATDEANGT